MIDTKIIKIISIIHVTIVNILFFIIFTLCVAFVALHNGVSIEKYSNKYVKIEQLYIKWNEKLDLSIKNIEIKNNKNKKSDENELNIHQITNNISKFALFIRIFEHLDLKAIHIDNVNISFRYTQNNGGILQASSQDFKLHSTLSPAKDKLYIHIDKLQLIRQNTNIKGTILLHNYDVQTSLNIDINKDISLKLDAISNQNSLHYKISSLQHIKSIDYLIKMLHLPTSISYWIIDAIDMSYLDIQECHGWIDYNHIDDAIKHIYVKADIKDLNYSYNKELDAIHTQHTELIFNDGILFIYPKKAYSYGQNLAKSWVKIDFSKSPIIISVNLLFNGKLNKDVLKILKQYKVNLPFLQKKGTVDVKLKVEINLETLNVDAQGDFYTKKANFDYLGLNIDIYNARIILDNYKVTIKDMLAHYGDIAVANVDVNFNAQDKTGNIKFRAKSIKLNDINLTMKKHPLSIVYHIIPHHNYIDVESSSWNFLGYELALNPLKIPFDTDKLLLKIPTTKIKVKNMATIYTSGTLKLPSLQSDFDIDIVAFDYFDFKLLDEKIKLKLLYDNMLKITNYNPIKLKRKGNILLLKNSNMQLQDSNLSIKSNLNFNDLLQTNIDFNYMITDKKGSLKLKNLKVKIEKNPNLLDFNTTTTFKINHTKKDLYTLQNKALDTNITFTNKLFSLKIDKSAPLLHFSPLLQKKHLENFSLSVDKNYTSDKIDFSASLLYPHQILVVNDKPLNNYKIKGNFNTKNKTTYINIEDKVDITIDKNITVNTHDVGLNLFAFINTLDTNNSQESNNTDLPIVNLHSKNSYIYISKSRKILADSIELKFEDNTLGAVLKYKKGKALLRLKDEDFTLYGTNFNDNFISHLFALSKFQGGKLDFSMEGKLTNYVGTLNLTNTTVLEYKLLNNILAFVNTIPSLMTFSLPGYDSKGLLVDHAYINFTAKDDMFNISDIYMDSKEIDILGHGTASYVKNSINLELNLKTDLASTLSKIPLVGYILFDKDSISTTIKVYGKLDNPKVKSLLAKEIIVAPLNILKRTIMLPFNLF